MSIFGNIMSAIFGRGAGTTATQPSAGASTANAPGSGTQARSSAPQPMPQAGQAPVDVEAVLNRLASEKKQKLDWRHSIVDLMKLLDLDSSLSARKQLARELHYSGSTDDSAAMNVWLHKQVMTKLAENGGKVPAELRQSA